MLLNNGCWGCGDNDRTKIKFSTGFTQKKATTLHHRNINNYNYY